jgi:hypothetical protein
LQRIQQFALGIIQLKPRQSLLTLVHDAEPGDKLAGV